MGVKYNESIQPVNTSFEDEFTPCVDNICQKIDEYLQEPKTLEQAYINACNIVQFVKWYKHNKSKLSKSDIDYISKHIESTREVTKDNRYKVKTVIFNLK